MRFEVSRISGKRPRVIGANSRLGVHGDTVNVPFVRVTDDDGAWGIGPYFGKPEDLTEPPDFAAWDLRARRAGVPVRALAGGALEPVRCYDTQLCMDDLHLSDHAVGAALIAQEALEGRQRGHRAFKLKVGRGARHMSPEDGFARDVAVVRAVREAIGESDTLMLDGNDGLTLNLTKRLLEQTSGIYWMEEPFREDPVLLDDLRAWLGERGLATLIADGEGAPPAWLADYVDVLQFDIYWHGFSAWLETIKTVRAMPAPHHFGGWYGNYAACHLPGVAWVEWDEATMDGLAAPGYEIRDGFVHIPKTPGFGIEIDERAWRAGMVWTSS